MFGTDFLQNALLVFTRFGYDSKSIKRREAGKEMKEEQVIKEYTQHFERTFTFTPNKNQFCFIDNSTV